MLSRALFDAIEAVIGDRDNINPALLINSATDFSSFDFGFIDASDSMSASQSQTETEGAKAESGRKSCSPGKSRKGRGKKRKHSPSPEPKLVELFTEKWKEEKEERRLDRELAKQAFEAMDKHADRMLGALERTLDHLTKD